MPSRYLITGCGGFIGFHLSESLIKSGKTIYGICHQKELSLRGIQTVRCDIRDRASVYAAVTKSKPEIIYHLAAQSNIMLSWQHLEDTFNANVHGTYYLLEAAKELKLNSRIIIFGSSSEYGTLPESEKHHKENISPFKPASPYALSKVAADLMGRMYYEVFGVSVISVLPFYVIGPRKAPDAPSDFAKAIVRCEHGEISELKVGNLEVVRDVVDVRDAIGALRLIEEKGESGSSYNLCSGQGVKLKLILDHLLDIAKSKLKITVDSSKFRPGDNNRIVGSPEKLNALGWKPTFSLRETLEAILHYWRETL